MHRLQQVQAFDHSILQNTMTDDEDYRCEQSKRTKLRFSLSEWLSCFHQTGVPDARFDPVLRAKTFVNYLRFLVF